MELALKDIRRHLGKFLATIVGVAMLLAAYGAGAAWGWLAARRIGGLTGDVLGAIVELGETAALLAVALRV